MRNTFQPASLLHRWLAGSPPAPVAVPDCSGRVAFLRSRTIFDVDALAEEAARDWEAVEWCVVALLECARSQAARASDVTTDLPASGTLAALCVRLEPTVKALAFHSRLTIGSTIKFKDEEMCSALAKVCL